ncbi:MAG: helix-turn-helix domain-containing protein [Haloarculaceae archaeon]
MERDATSGVRVSLAVEATDTCPVAAATTEGATARSVRWSRVGAEGGDRNGSGAVSTDGAGAIARESVDVEGAIAVPRSAIEEFDLVGDDGGAPLPPDASTVFETDETSRVQFSRDGTDCICDRVEGRGCIVTDVWAGSGKLRLTFHASDTETVREVVEDLTATYDSVSIERLARAGDDAEEDLVLVDRGRLTERQCDVLETALQMGYFERPRGANATEVAAELGIAPSTFAEHLASAQSKVLDSLLED